MVDFVGEVDQPGLPGADLLGARNGLRDRKVRGVVGAGPEAVEREDVDAFEQAS